MKGQESWTCHKETAPKVTGSWGPQGFQESFDCHYCGTAQNGPTCWSIQHIHLRSCLVFMEAPWRLRNLAMDSREPSSWAYQVGGRTINSETADFDKIEKLWKKQPFHQKASDENISLFFFGKVLGIFGNCEKWQLQTLRSNPTYCLQVADRRLRASWWKGGGFNFFFTPKIVGRFPFWLYFSDGLKPPTR